jgi:hypothetical protein
MPLPTRGPPGHFHRTKEKKMSRELVIVAIGVALFGVAVCVAVWERNPPGPTVGERIAAIERDCELQLFKGSKIKYREDLYDALAKMTRGEFDRWKQSAKEAQRHCIGLALEFDPEAATVFTNVHGKID